MSQQAAVGRPVVQVGPGGPSIRAAVKGRRFELAVNDQYSQTASKFFAAVPSGTGADGSPGATANPAMPDDAYRVQNTMPYQSVQNAPTPMTGVGLDDVAVPGQLYEGVSGEGPSDTANTGAGRGSSVMEGHHPNSMARRPS